MKLIPEYLYHIYGRGNNRQKIFFNHENYLFFLEKIRKQLLPHFDFLAYCLMPNHFHFLVQTKPDYQQKVATDAFRLLLSSYTRAINKQKDRVGSLFQQKSKAKLLEEVDGYPLSCFRYIHQNPVKAGLVNKIEDWNYSSFKDYIGLRKGTLCNQELAYQLLDFPQNKALFYNDAYQSIDDNRIEELY